MRIELGCGVAVCVMALQTAGAQQQMGAQQMSTGPNQSITAAILAPLTGEPYQAEKVTHSTQTLSDGTVITHDTRGLIARDTQGRMREDLYVVHSSSVNGHQTDMDLQSATVGDPIAHTMLIWTGVGKIAMQMQLPSLAQPKSTVGALSVAPPPPPPGSAVRMLKEDAPPPPRNGTLANNTLPITGMARFRSRDDVRTEQLGQQSLEGVLVTGTRTTTTIPTGEIGNDRPIIVVHEEWRSPELKIVLKTIDKDPRTGEQTMELEKVIRTDPDQALFRAPAGYTVQDMSQMLKGLGDLGKPKPQ